jgi:hypothetical protein
VPEPAPEPAACSIGVDLIIGYIVGVPHQHTSQLAQRVPESSPMSVLGVTGKEDACVEQASEVRTIMSSSSAAGKGNDHVEPALGAQTSTAQSLQESRIVDWRLLSLYIR